MEENATTSIHVGVTKAARHLRACEAILKLYPDAITCNIGGTMRWSSKLVRPTDIEQVPEELGVQVPWFGYVEVEGERVYNPEPQDMRVLLRRLKDTQPEAFKFLLVQGDTWRT